MAMQQAFWAVERGIGENRIALIAGEQILAAYRQCDDGTWPLGAVISGQITAKMGAGHRFTFIGDDGSEAILTSCPKNISIGSKATGRVTREQCIENIAGQSRIKPAILRYEGDETAPTAKSAPPLYQALAEAKAFLPEKITIADDVLHHDVRTAQNLDNFGWDEVMEEAQSGIVSFADGQLLAVHTPAMTVIDIDGLGAPDMLAIRAAPVVARAIMRLGLSGNMVVDFPGMTRKADRIKVAESFDDALLFPAERTGVNGFGLMQIISRKCRMSLVEQAQYRPDYWQLCTIMRRAEKESGHGDLALNLGRKCHQLLASKPQWLEQLQQRCGQNIAVHLVADKGAYFADISSISQG